MTIAEVSEGEDTSAADGSAIEQGSGERESSAAVDLEDLREGVCSSAGNGRRWFTWRGKKLMGRVDVNRQDVQDKLCEMWELQLRRR